MSCDAAVPARLRGSANLALVGADVDVPLVTGGWRRYVNLDYAASAPCLSSVSEAVEALLPWYSSVHRGAGYKSQLATAAYEGAREAVHSFVGARHDDTVVFTRNTTDAINLVAAALPADASVFAYGAEHHANLPTRVSSRPSRLSTASKRVFMSARRSSKRWSTPSKRRFTSSKRWFTSAKRELTVPASTSIR